MLTSSPTISAPSSPSNAFHTATNRRSSYHASRRTSTSSSAPSPRFAVSSAAVRRFDVPQTPKPALSAPSPVPTSAPSPQGCKRSYADASTQYTPPGFPPTYHPQSQPAGTQEQRPHDKVDTVDTVPLTAPAVAHTQRGEASAAPAVTEPTEPQVRVDPQPVNPVQYVQPQTRRTPKENVQPPERALEELKEASTVLQVPSSPAKRARPQEPNVKVMPLQYETCDVKDLGVLISDMLMELVRLNDGYPLRDGTLTRFHSRYI